MVNRCLHTANLCSCFFLEWSFTDQSPQVDDHLGLEDPYLRRPPLRFSGPLDRYDGGERETPRARRTGRTVSGEWRRWAGAAGPATTRRRAQEPGSNGMPTPSSTTTPGNCFVSRYVLQRSADWARRRSVASGGWDFPRPVPLVRAVSVLPTLRADAWTWSFWQKAGRNSWWPHMKRKLQI